MFVYPATAATWAPVIAAKQAAPTVPIVSIVNADNGPGTQTDPNYVAAIQQLRNAGVVTYAYVYTLDGARPISNIIQDITTWQSLYGNNFSGLFVDQVAPTASTAPYYQQITSFAKQSGFSYVVDNPGVDIEQGLLGAADEFVIYENTGLPSLTFLNGWHQQYPKSTWAFIASMIPEIDTTFLASAAKLVGKLYLTNDPSYSSFPPYLTQLAQALA